MILIVVVIKFICLLRNSDVVNAMNCIAEYMKLVHENRIEKHNVRALAKNRKKKEIARTWYRTFIPWEKVINDNPSKLSVFDVERHFYIKIHIKQISSSLE